ncbi:MULTISPECIES: MFS transporter [unclassified Luteococcus]|uniref:MFS transporter n=1 Tax=unclassified Luteococcus TaxID=2639923 RepID=UPI00313CFA00
MSSAAVDQDKPIRSLIPERMDKMPWSRFHWMVIFGLGTAWILDGLEIQIVANAGFAETFGMSSGQVGMTATIYLIGEVVGALVFGRLTDTMGRKKMFVTTLAVYLIGSAAAAFAPNTYIFWILRFIAGMGIGGEYSAINSAIDELIPGKFRGRVDLAINGTYWFGAMLGALVSNYMLAEGRFAQDMGWRLAFLVGPILGLSIIYLRRHIPESPRWLVTHGRGEEAERIVVGIEEEVQAQGKQLPQHDEADAMWIKAREGLNPKQLAWVFFKLYPTRTFLGLTLMITQSFLYNAIFFTSAMVLTKFHGKTASEAALYFFAFAAGNLMGPLLLGHFFDTVGRRKMIGGSYSLAALILLVSAWMFNQDMLTATTHTLLWCASFFFASAGASAGYLTVSEIFPLEVRGQAISYFFAVAQTVGAFGPAIFGWLVGDGSDRGPLFIGYVAASLIMLFGGLVAFKFGVDAEGKSLEEIAPPLSSYDEQGNETLHIPV